MTLESELTDKSSMIVLAGEVIVEIDTLLLLCTTLHHPKFAEFHFPGWDGIMREGALPMRLLTLPLHEVGADLI
jgi:hypothetical protein